METISGKTVLVTGGTGSFGKSFVEFILKNFRVQKIIIFSRDELKQFRMQEELAIKYRKVYGANEYDNVIRFFLGDVRDLARLQRAFRGVDIVIHAAALKQVPALEYNPTEAIQTNIIGTQNVITAAIDQGVKKTLLLSTDKCVQPINLYGATKLCAEKLFTASNVYALGNSRFSIVRYGNVMGSRGSIIETILHGDAKEPLKVTHKDMTRFWLELDQCFHLVLNSLKNMVGGEIFVPKAPSMKLMDLCDALAPHRKKIFIGVRPGEKIHETLITEEEAERTVDLGRYFVILPSTASSDFSRYKKYVNKGKFIGNGFRYTSDTNKECLDSKKVFLVLKKYDSLWPPNNQ